MLGFAKSAAQRTTFGAMSMSRRDFATSTTKSLAAGGYIGNPNKVKRGKKARMQDMSPEEKVKVRNKSRRRGFGDVECKMFPRYSVVIHPNGATSIMEFAHPANFPKYVLESDPSNHKAWASPAKLAELEREAMEFQETQRGHDPKSPLFTKLKKR